MTTTVYYRDISPGGTQALFFFGFVILFVSFIIARLVYANYKRYEYNTKRAWKVFLICGAFSIPVFLFGNASSDGGTAFSISENISQKYSNIAINADEIKPVVPEYRKGNGKALEVKDRDGNVYHLIASGTNEPHIVVPEGSTVPAPVVK